MGANRSRSLPGIGLFALLLLSPRLSRAEDEEAMRLRLFRERYELAGRAYNSKDYAAAIPALQDAYAIQPVPQILFNIAQAYRKLEDWRRALTYFELYRALIKDSMPDKLADLDPLILEMKERDVAAHTPQVIEKTTTKTLYVQTERPLPRWLRPVGITSSIAGLGLLAAGGTFLGLDGRCVDSPQAPSLACDQLYNTKTLGTALTAVGTGVLVLGAVTFGLSLRRPTHPKVVRSSEAPNELLPTMDQVMLPPTPSPDTLPPDAEPPPAGWNRDGTRRKR